MGYRESLRKVSFVIDGVSRDLVGGSFRGQPFFVEDYTKSGIGRALAVKPIPFSNNYVIQDNGGKIPKLSLKIFVCGDECQQAMANLEAACNEEGPGELIHPYLGVFRAECLNLSFRSGRSSLGYIEAEAEFQPTPETSRSVRQNLAGKVKTDAKKFRQDSCNKFATLAKIAGATKTVLDSFVKVSEKMLDVALSARESLAYVNDFVSEVGKVRANIDALALVPADFAARVDNILSATAEIFGIETDKKKDVDEYLAILLAEVGAVAGPSLAMLSFSKKIAAAQVVVSLVDAEFESVDTAIQYQNKIAEAFDALIQQTEDIEDYMALSDLQASAFSYLRETMANIAVVVERPINATVDVISLCYDTYGNLDKVEDILSRNGFVQGLFVTPGKVKVLSK